MPEKHIEVRTTLSLVDDNWVYEGYITLRSGASVQTLIDMLQLVKPLLDQNDIAKRAETQRPSGVNSSYDAKSE